MGQCPPWLSRIKRHISKDRMKIKENLKTCALKKFYIKKDHNKSKTRAIKQVSSFSLYIYNLFISSTLPFHPRLSFIKNEHLKHVFRKEKDLDGSQGDLRDLGRPQRLRQGQPGGVQQVPFIFIKMRLTLRASQRYLEST